MLTIVGVMGGAVVSAEVAEQAEVLGRLIAENGWVLLTGGRDAGVMAAASRGAAAAGGLVVGILPGDSTDGVAPGVHIAIPTGMGDARNAINALASHVVIAMHGGAGTISEVALALKSGRDVITLGLSTGEAFAGYRSSGRLTEADSPYAAVEAAARVIAQGGHPPNSVRG